MRLYTADKGRGEVFAVFCPEPAKSGQGSVLGSGDKLYRLADLAPRFEGMDMTDVIAELSAGRLLPDGDSEQDIRVVLERSAHILAEKTAGCRAYAPGELRLLAPIVRPRQDVVCLGINYDDHAKEARAFSKEAFDKERPDTIYFSKRVNRAVGDGEDIPAHEDLVDSLDYECELGVILGRDASRVSEEKAREYIFGYTVINDISARNVQTRHKQWYLGKSLDGFTPIGPCIVTADELTAPDDLAIESFVNGELRQCSNTGNMMQTPEGAIAELSAGMTLLAGTIIATGTPAGVGMGFQPPRFLHPGDVVECRIEGIGSLRNTIRTKGEQNGYDNA